MFGFSINTLSLFGLVLAIGLVVDDAIVVVEAVERHIEEGMAPKDAALKAMQEVSGPVVAIALILAAVFVPTIFIAGITGRLYQQFALTIAISVIFSAFNALSLSPALSALLLKHRKPTHGPLARFFDWFNRVFGRVTNGYVQLEREADSQERVKPGAAGCRRGAGLAHREQAARRHFCRRKTRDMSTSTCNCPTPPRCRAPLNICKRVEAVLAKTPGVKYYTTVLGFSLLSQAQTTYNALFFVTLQAVERAQKSLRTNGRHPGAH